MILINPYRFARTPILDTYPGAAAAYSFKLLRTGYSGPCLRLRNATTNAETDIGFVGGAVDTAAMLSHCGTNDGRIVRWYDQSGNANPLIQTNGSFQPLIVSLGNLVLADNGHPATFFDGSNDFLTLTNQISSAAPFSVFQIHQKFVNKLGPVLSSSNANAPTTVMDFGNQNIFIKSSSGNRQSTTTHANYTPKSMAGVATAALPGRIWINGSEIAMQNAAGTVATNFIDYGRRVATMTHAFAQEFIFYASDKTSDVTAITNYQMDVWNIGDNANYLTASPGYLIGVCGQSNGTDRFTISGNLPVAQQGPQADCFTCYRTTNESAEQGNWQPINAGVNTTTGGGVSGLFGLNVVIANRLKTTYSKVGAFVPTAIGGTGLANPVSPGWHPTHTGEYFDRLVNNYANARITANGLTPVILWVHGEFDGNNATYAGDYEANLTLFISTLRTRLSLPNLKFIITQLRSDCNVSHASTIRTAQANVAANVANVHLLDTSAYPLSSDGLHYEPQSASYGGTQSAILMGQAIADLISTF